MPIQAFLSINIFNIFGTSTFNQGRMLIKEKKNDILE